VFTELGNLAAHCGSLLTSRFCKSNSVGYKIMISGREKTAIDCIDRPEPCYSKTGFDFQNLKSAIGCTYCVISRWFFVLADVRKLNQYC